MASRAIFLCHTDGAKVLLHKWMGYYTSGWVITQVDGFLDYDLGSQDITML